MDIEYLAGKALEMRRRVVRTAYKASSGHLSTAFSQMEVLVALYYGGVLRYDASSPSWPGRDRFILSKGQGGLGLYPILADVGYFPMDELDTFAQVGSRLGVHSEFHVPGVEILTGSLGHGLPVATGMALAARNDSKDHLVFCMLGDGELYEGSNWEAMFTAAHLRLGRLICVVDNNHQATIGRLDSIKALADGPDQMELGAKFQAFGFEVRHVEGHDFNDILSVLNSDCLRPRSAIARPLCVVSNTIKGKGCGVMERQEFFPSHYKLPYGKELMSILNDLGMDADEFKTQLEGVSLGY
jgi:transketolase